MASLSPIPIGSPDRLETTFNLVSGASLTDTIFDDRNSVARVIQNTGNGPVLSYARNTSLQPDSISSTFGKQNKSLYKKISPKTDSGTGFFDFGPSQPFVTVNLNDSSKRLKRFDTRVLPIGSVIQDTVRISKFTVSGKGILFNAKQFILQGQNAFNETRIYNPLSVLQATIRPTSLGFIPRPNRHITMGSGLLDTFLGTLGIKDNTGTPPKGTAAADDKLDTLPDLNADKAKGLIRAPTGAPARQRLLLKYGGTTSNEKGSFLGNMVRKFLPMLATMPNQFDGVTGDHKYRADQDLYAMFIEYYKKQAADKPEIYNNFVQGYYGNDTPSSEGKKPGEIPTKGLPYSYSKYTLIQNSGGSDDGTLVLAKYKELKEGNFTSRYRQYLNSPNNKEFSFSSTPSGGGPVNVKSKTDFSSQIAQTYNDIVRYQNTNPFAMKYSELSTVAKFGAHVEANEKSRIVDSLAGKGFAGGRNPDRINTEDILSETEFNKTDRRVSDQIAFWFHDIVNKKYLQFRATVNGINDSSAIEWNEVSYLGMPDKVFNYKGFTRSLGFSFVVYLNSVRELHPTWKKLNYLMSFRSPSKYIDGKYMVPPIVELRIGDMYHNVPIVINSITFSIPEGVSWETLPANEGDYTYLSGLIKIPNVKYGQFPNRVEINIGAYILESENFSRVGNTSFGPDQEAAGNFHLRSFEGKDTIVGGVLTT